MVSSAPVQKSTRIDKPKMGVTTKMNTHDLLKQLDGYSRIKLLLSMTLAEILTEAKKTDIGMYLELSLMITELNNKLNEEGENNHENS